MKLSEYKQFLDIKKDMETTFIANAQKQGMTIISAKVVDSYPTFVVFSYNAGHGEEIQSVSVWSLIEDANNPGGCTSCQNK